MEENIIYKSERKAIYKVDNIVIKTYNDTYNTSQVLNEALNQSKVAEAGISAPKVYEVKFYNGKLGITMDFIDGYNLNDIINDNKKDEDKYLDLFVNTYHEMSKNKNLNLNNSYGRIKNKIFSSELPANVKYGLFYKLREMEFARDVIHGDFTPSNIILTKDNKSMIVDWGHVAFGEKEFDVAITYALFDLSGRKELGDKYLEKLKKVENIDVPLVFKVIILAYIYIVDRYEGEMKKEIYNRIYSIIKSEEA